MGKTLCRAAGCIARNVTGVIRTLNFRQGDFTILDTKTPADKVTYVCRNLHTNMWSISSCKTGKLIEHRTTVYLSDPEFRVGEKGRQRVLSTHTKNVHAGAVGKLFDDDCLIQQYSTLPTVPIYYDPVKNRRFLDSDNNPIDSAAFAEMDVSFLGE